MPLGDILNRPMGMARGASRRLARAIPFRPYKLALDHPVVSFTFDDFPTSCVTEAAPVLEDAGMRGTFYYASGLAGGCENGQEIASRKDAADLAQRGHEIGAHTHRHIDVHRTANYALLEDVDRNKREIEGLTAGTVPTSFAYPFGRLDLRSKLALMNEFAGLRGIQSGINAGMIDLSHLLAQELYDSSSTIETMDRLLDRVEHQRGWLIFYTHDVRQHPTPIGCSPRYFAQVVDLVRRRNFRVDTVAGRLAALGLAKHI